jgi:hypothetical protein
VTARLALLAVLASACNTVFGVDHVDDPRPADAALEPPDAFVRCPLVDDFNDGLLAPQWTLMEASQAPVSVTEQAGVLAITLSPSVTGYNGIRSTTRVSMIGRLLTVHVPQVTSQAGFVETYIKVNSVTLVDELIMDAGAGNMLARARSGGVNDDSTPTTYSPTEYAWWRILHEDATGMIHFQVSTDGIGWTSFRPPTTVGWDLSNVSIEIGAGAYGTGNASPGQARFDDASLCAPAS